MTHDYNRNGTTFLFEALSMHDGKVTGGSMPDHQPQEITAPRMIASFVENLQRY